ncbi:MAG: toxin-antitoxin system protein [Paludibacteraceae bacterium]|nr:toxin-antitoxin system protein [Paludibacteraceae bacterium]
MATTIVRKPVSLRLREDIVERLKENAILVNRTFNNYVESILLDVVYDNPNEVTRKAIEEVRKGKKSQKANTDIDEMFNDILKRRQ